MSLIMKKLIPFYVLLLLVSISALAQNTSNDNYIGNWTDDNSWVSGNAPGTNGNIGTVVIQGYITLDGNLSISGGANVTVNDTLWITGDLTITGSADFSVASGGLLIVEGNTNASGNSFAVVDGLAVFMGDVDVNNSRNFDETSFTENTYVFGTPTYDGADYTGIVPNESDLSNDNSNLYGQIQNGILPIELVSFAATSASNAVKLNWTTAMEENFDFFTVERAGANLDFEAIGTVQGNGFSTSPISYQFEDRSPLSGVSYYRLKATDFDGSFEYHKVISVQFNTTANSQIYPNPVNNRHFSIKGTATQLQVINLTGHLVMSEQISTATREVALPSQMKAGTYVAVLTHSDGTQERQQLIVR
jgi:hypothetical protein